MWRILVDDMVSFHYESTTDKMRIPSGTPEQEYILILMFTRLHAAFGVCTLASTYTWSERFILRSNGSENIILSEISERISILPYHLMFFRKIIRNIGVNVNQTIEMEKHGGLPYSYEWHFYTVRNLFHVDTFFFPSDLGIFLRTA